MDTNRKIFRYVLPVDDAWHTLDLTGPILHVATRGADFVEVWAMVQPGVDPVGRAFRVVGTGQSFPPALAFYIGTAITPDGRLVWHVMEHDGTAAGQPAAAAVQEGLDSRG